MGLPQLQTCCFFFDLKTGNMIMGSLNALLSFVLFVVMVVKACTLGSFEAEAQETHDPSLEAAITGLYVMAIIMVLMFLAKFFLDVLFIYGVVSERSGIIRAYFIMLIVFFLLSIFTFFLNAHHFSAGTICMQLFNIGLNIYAILLSHSFYNLLNTREEV